VTGALAGIRVLDLSRVLAGPWASQTLGDLGAEVIKIERPGTGDETRGWGPPFLADAAGARGDAAYFLCANRNKKSVAIDTARAEGAQLVRRLAAGCDVVIENFKAGGLAAYGLDYAALAEANPGIVYCSITGFGQTGPYRDRPGYDFLIQGLGGLMSVTGVPDGEPGAGPQKAGVAVTDILTGLYATTAILAALLHRGTSGTGQYIDLGLLDVQVASLANQSMNYLVSGSAPQRMGNAHPNIVPYQDFPTSDGAAIVTAGNDAQFARLCDALGRPEWCGDERFARNDARVAHRDELVAAIGARTRTFTTSELIARLEAAGVPCGPINTIAGVFADPQVAARGLAVPMQRSDGTPVTLVANPIVFSRTPVSYRLPPPALGADTASVLAGRLGLDAAAIARLAEAGIVELG
jgi:crotonobetainyl-CoA:carnitine CoA-transferase CaiB-like acyl-CoA transferase